MAIHVTYQQILDGLRKAVDDRGEDYIYQPPRDENGDTDGVCLYVHSDQKPGCIVGYVLADLGVPLDTLKQFDPQRANDGTFITHSKLAERVVWGLIDQDILEFASLEDQSKAIDKLRAVQNQQDRQKPWSEAIRYAALAPATAGTEDSDD